MTEIRADRDGVCAVVDGKRVPDKLRCEGIAYKAGEGHRFWFTAAPQELVVSAVRPENEGNGRIEIRSEGARTRIYLDGEDISHRVRSIEVTFLVNAPPVVRLAMLDAQGSKVEIDGWQTPKEWENEHKETARRLPDCF